MFLTRSDVSLKRTLTRHLHLTDQMHIFLLVLLSDEDVGTIGLQIPDFTHAKFLDL